MTTRFGRHRAERLMRGDSTSADPLSPLLAAARAPGTADELSGDEAVVADFVAAFSAVGRSTAETIPADRPSRLSGFRARLAIAVTAATAGVTGLVAAAAGVLPARLQQPAHNIFHAPAPRTSPSLRPSTSNPSTSTTRKRPTTAPTSSPTGSTPASSAPTKTSPGATSTPATSPSPGATTPARKTTPVTTPTPRTTIPTTTVPTRTAPRTTAPKSTTPKTTAAPIGSATRSADEATSPLRPKEKIEKPKRPKKVHKGRSGSRSTGTV